MTIIPSYTYGMKAVIIGIKIELFDLNDKILGEALDNTFQISTEFVP